MKLIIVESPNKIKTIKGFLDSSYSVMASVGHIRLLDKSGKYKLGIDIDNDFKPKYVNDPEKKAVIKTLKEAVKKADVVYLASDPDQEGEAIAWHLKETLAIPAKKCKRITFNEITKKAVTEAINNPRDIDMDRVNAQETRRLIDRIMGFRLSAFTMNKLSAKSAGRVQSAALKILADKENAIKAFIPETFFEIYLPFTKNKESYKAQFKGTKSKKYLKVKTEAAAKKIVSECKANPYSVYEINQKERIVKPKDPYTTSTFQQEVSAKLGYGSKKAMSIAQELFQGIEVGEKHISFISYIRTDSTRLSDEFVESAKKLIIKWHGDKYYQGVSKSSTKKEEENAHVQGAHEAIRPTDPRMNPESAQKYLTSEQLKVYTLIYNRTFAALMSDAKMLDTEVLIENGKYVFGLNGNQVIFDGFLKVYKEYVEDEDDSKSLPVFKKSENIKTKGLDIVKKETSAPKRFTEATLIKEMEKTGIGRPSTYAGTVETLKDRNYVDLDKKSLVVTDSGLLVSAALDEHFSSIINTTYTSEMEKMLDEIAEGKKVEVEELKKFYNEFNPMLKEAMKMEREPAKEAGKMCPECGAPLVIRKNRKGEEFVACSRYPKCKHTESLTVKEKTSFETTTVCPSCGKGHLIKLKSRKGEWFYGCTNYRNGCKFTSSVAQIEGDPNNFSDIALDND